MGSGGGANIPTFGGFGGNNSSSGSTPNGAPPSGNIVNNRLVFNLSTSFDLNDPSDESGSDSTSKEDDDTPGSTNVPPLEHVFVDAAAGLSNNQPFSALFTKSLQKIYMNPSLRTLSLANIGRGEIMMLLGCFAKNSAITSLNLSNNALGDQGAALLSTALMSNRSLLTINIDSNDMTNVGWNHILTALTEIGKSIIKESPSIPLTTWLPRLHSMVYPRHDFERLIVATDSTTRRMDYYILLARLNTALVNNGNLYYNDTRKYHPNRLPLGFTHGTRPETFFPPTPTVLYPRTAMPADVLASLKIKIEPPRNVQTNNAISTIAHFLKGRPKPSTSPLANSSSSSLSASKRAGNKETGASDESPSVSPNPKSHANERTSPVPFKLGTSSSPNTLTPNTISPIFVTPMTISPNTLSPLSIVSRPKSMAYPLISLHTPDPNSTTSSTSTSTTTTTLGVTSNNVGLGRTERKMQLNYTPVTEEQVFDAIANLETATTYCLSSCSPTPPKSPRTVTAGNVVLNISASPSDDESSPTKPGDHDNGRKQAVLQTLQAPVFTRTRSQSMIEATSLHHSTTSSDQVQSSSTSSLSSLE
ncbi:hypothetical protein SAMD00019534_107060 [Acytostelium subglobosum LB1]|uniref:hypothetical protein n=1 Tax=Acytostelium subglobosum LB1 TaxID=1410327 RepID=UPI000644B923|nr:hypothetical protein SAMD00019534_107060 [Acytostelium subglobosum LB1]GAM27530.1 hypothetical protein SAMD00019534_107060 [Acytostelium subglobosum LB1]|eukprot:XP_012749595.1 hypothetical protein SAMD00019534_107060 [Acytostelium subglobosum LB1]